MDFIKVKKGKNSWKRFVSSFIVIFIFIIFGALPYILIGQWIVETDGNPNTYFDVEQDVYVGLNPLLDFLLMDSQFIFWLLGLFIAIRLIHKRKFRTLITPNRTIDWKKTIFGFSTFFLILTVTTIADAILHPGNYSLNDIRLADYLILFILVLILTPIQTTCEEVFFRGYLMQMLGKKINNLVILSVIAGAIFGSLHFANPEMAYSPILVGADYVLTGFIWCYITVKTNSAELSIGAHAANNMFLGWFLTMENSALGDIPSLFVTKVYAPAISLMWSVISLGAFLIFALKKYNFTKL